MALQRYNHTLQLLLSQQVNLETIKAMLLSNAASFAATDTTVNAVTNTGGYEVSGFGWDAGGELLIPIISITDTDGALLDFEDISVMAAGGSIGVAYSVLIFSEDIPLFFETFLEPQTAADGTPMNLNFDPQGLLRVRDA